MSHDIARRGFLRRTISIIPVAAIAGAAHTQQQAPASSAPGSPPAPAVNTSSASSYSPSFFHPAEWTFLSAAVARLIPADDIGPGAVEAGVPEFIDRQMEGPFGHDATRYSQGPFVESPPEFGYQGKMPPRDVYRAGMAAADSYCKGAFDGKLFSQLDAAQQDQVLKGLESGDIKLDGVSGTTFFGFLLQNTKEGYLSDPIHGGNKNAGSWKMIGFPGARADFIDWVGRPGEKYPLPPVTINGPQG